MKILPKFFCLTLGCKVNQYDSAALKRLLLANGWHEIKKNQVPDCLIVNTCAVTKVAISKNQKAINALKRQYPQAKIAVIGCWPKVYSINSENLGVDLVITDRDLEIIFRSLAKMMNVNFSHSSCGHLLVTTDRTRYFLKIQEGCQQFCSYCVIPYARGKLKSRLKNEVLDEAREAIKKGYQEIVLCGIHLGLYGVDLNPPENLTDLIKSFLLIAGSTRLRLSSLEVRELTPKIIQIAASDKRLCPHFHLPLQAGSNKILKLMNRPYNLSYFAEKVKLIRRFLPKAAITTDLIVGFPGETDKDFNQSLKFCRQIAFAKIHVFPFSAHELTPAFSFPDQVPIEIIRQRSAIARQLSISLEKKYQNSFKDQELDLIIFKRNKSIKVGISQYGFIYYRSIDKNI